MLAAAGNEIEIKFEVQRVDIRKKLHLYGNESIQFKLQNHDFNYSN